MNATTSYLRTHGPILVSLAVFVVAGLIVAGFAWHQLPAPAVPPDKGENDGSLAAAFLTFGVPLTTWLLWTWGGRNAVGLALATGVIGFAAGAVMFS